MANIIKGRYSQLLLLKGHALYNSNSARKPADEQWVEKAFELQKLYWGENSVVDLEAQKTLTKKLKITLGCIRDKYRKEIQHTERLVAQFDGNHTNSATQTEYHKLMMKVSLGCSDDMRNFARLVLGESVRVLKTKPACAFETVAIGSIARGEATPYSDLEYLFLIKNRAKKTARYFEILAMTSYFLIGNLGETKLSYMAIEELHGWFDDKSKNGFKIDGVAKGAGNIPTGNGLKNVNHFIITPEQLAKRYKTILDKDRKSVV